jgi:hypothetical protein
MRSTLSTEKFESQEERADGGVDIYRALSRIYPLGQDSKSGHCPVVLDIIWLGRTLSDQTEHCSVRDFWEGF